MNYQIMTVDQDGKKTFYGAKFRKDNLSQYHIKSVLKGNEYHGIKNKPFELL